MINNRTSFLDRQQAIRKLGPRPSPDKKRFGYYFTGPELRAWFGHQGFNVAGKHRGWMNQINTWAFIDMVTIEGDLLSEDCIVWFHCDPDLRTILMSKAEKAGYSITEVMI